jgi:hypothetical protein
MYAGQQGLARLASETGGLAFENSNDLRGVLDRVLDDQAGYYLLGYRPSAQTFEEKGGYRSFHRIKVEVTRPGLRARSRVGFFGATDDETKPKFETPLDRLRTAMLSPFRSSGVRLRLTALYYNDPKRGPIVRSLLHIDARDLQFQLDEDGAPKAKVDVIAVASGPDDEPVAREARSYVFEPKDGRIQEALRQGAVYELQIPVRKRGAYRIQAAVRDGTTEKIGSASQFLEVPELKNSRLALTSILLDDGGQSPGSPERDATAAVRRQFRPGSQVRYMCVIEKGANGRSGAKLHAEVRILRDARQVYWTPVQTMPTPQGAAIAGMFKLSDRMPPGDYYVQVVAVDESAKRNTVAQQWTDFEVISAQ